MHLCLGGGAQHCGIVCVKPSHLIVFFSVPQRSGYTHDVPQRNEEAREIVSLTAQRAKNTGCMRTLYSTVWAIYGTRLSRVLLLKYTSRHDLGAALAASRVDSFHANVHEPSLEADQLQPDRALARAIQVDEHHALPAWEKWPQPTQDGRPPHAARDENGKGLLPT